MRFARGLAVSIALAAAAVAASVSLRAEGVAPYASPTDGARMPLGLRAERWSGDEAEARTGGVSRAQEQCRKWRAMAGQLGETFAGHTLRHTVLQRVCGIMEADRGEEAWDWPWGGLAQGRLLPPRTHRVTGAWEIRCGAAGTRRRCALIHVAPLPPDETIDSGSPQVVTHFVIDMVAGRESVLWRMYVPNDPDSDLTAAVGEAATHLVAVAPQRNSTRGIRYTLGRGEQVERFAACVASGCLMEAGLARASAVANRLWEGAPVEVAVTLSTGRIVPLVLPAKGFRSGLAELTRLRREESRGGGRR